MEYRTKISKKDARSIGAFMALGWAQQDVDFQENLSMRGIYVSDDVAFAIAEAATEYVEALDRRRPVLPNWWRSERRL